MTKYFMNSLGIMTKINDAPMSAYELAKYLEAREVNNPTLLEAAKVLRLQADEIEALREQLDELLD